LPTTTKPNLAWDWSKSELEPLKIHCAVEAALLVFAETSLTLVRRGSGSFYCKAAYRLSTLKTAPTRVSRLDGAGMRIYTRGPSSLDRQKDATLARVVPRGSLIVFTPRLELLQQLVFSCNDKNYADVDRHDYDNPNDLANPRQGQKPTKKEDTQKYANLYLRAF
jgi:hypothetical protein